MSRVLVAAFVFLATVGEAATISSTGAGGNWNVGGTWVGGVVPLPTDNAVIVSGSVVNVTTNETIVNLTLNGTGRLNFNTNSRTLTVNGTMTMNGTSQVSGNNNSRILSLQGDFNVPAGQSVSFAGVQIAQVITGTFNLAGTFTPTDNTGQKVFGNANFYDGCQVDATVTETITIAGNLSVLPTAPGLRARVGRLSLTVNGTTTVTGYLQFTPSGAGTKTFNNTITVAAGGTWDNTVGEDPVINCSIVNHGVWPPPTGGTGRYTVNVAGNYTYSGSRTISFTRLRIQTNATVTNLGTLELTHNNNQALTVNGGGVFNNGDGLVPATLLLVGSTDLVSLAGGSTVNFANAMNTVIYAAPVGQNIHPTTYYNLTCSGNNIASVVGATIVSNALSISGTTTVDVTGGTNLTGTGDLVMTGTSVLRLSTAGTIPELTGAGHSLAAGTTIEFYRAGAQTAASSALYPYQHVLISGNAGSAVNLDGISAVAGDLTVSNAGSFNNTLNTPPVIDVTGAFLYNSSANTTLSTSLTASSVTLSAGGFTYSNQTITLDKDNGFWAVTGAPVITAGGTAQVVFTTGLNQQIAGTTAPTFNNLVINNANDVTLNIATATVTGTLTLTSGRLITGSNTVVMPSGSSVTRTSGFVEGNLNKAYGLGNTTHTFEVGTNTSYTPATITCTSVTTAGTLTITTTDGDHPDIFSGLIEPSNTVNRYWSLTNNGIVFTAFSTGRMSGSFNWVNADEDALLDNTAILKWYNSSTLTWTGSDELDEVAEQNPPMTVSTVITTNTTSFTFMNPNQLPSGILVDFQIGEKIDPTFVTNRLTGANNWNNLATWIQQRTGIITLTNGSPTVTGTSTSFQSELVVGDNIMLIADPATVYTITGIDGVLQSMTVAPAPGISTSGGFGRQYIPGINPTISDVDAVTIGNTNIADATTTITLDIDAQVLTLTVGSTSRVTAQILTHQNSTRDLVVLANATVSSPNSAALTINAWNINDGTADVLGDVTIGSASSNNVNRVARINISTGTLSAGNLRFRPFNAAGREVQSVLNISGAGTVNLHGALTFNGSRGTLSSAAGSTFNFDRTASGQTIAIPTNSPAAWVYANIHGNNTSAAGVAFGFTSTATSVTGNVRVQTGLMTLTNFNIVGAAGSTFEVANGATFEMRSTSGGATGNFPSGFGTTTLGASSTVAYNQTGNNTWAVVTTTYGHLIIGQNGSTQTFRIANAVTNVAGNLTIGDGTSTPTLDGTGTATLNITGDLLINASASLDASNIANINLGGNWTDDGDFTEDTRTVTFNSPAANVLQTLGGAVSETFYNLRLNTSATTDVVRMTTDVSVLNVLTLTQGGLELNGRTLSINNSATTAVVRTNGYVKSESTTVPYGTMSWFIDNTTGAHVYPFGVSSTQYIPFTMNVTVAGNKGGTGTGFVPVSTYATAASNPPGEYPAGVTNLNGTSGGTSVTDRYWNITLGSAEFATTRPTSTITFTALDTEKPASWIALGEPPGNPNQLLAQLWNISSYWDPAQTSPAQTYQDNAPAPAGTFQVGVPSVTNYSTSWTITDSSAPLPVELVSFTAEARDGVVELNWTTESERDNDYFTVQRTADAERFEDVIRVRGQGTTTSVHHYTAEDVDAQPGRWYYRLRQTDFDGTFSYSRLIAVDVPVSHAQGIYPNPGTGEEINLYVPAGSTGKLAQVQIVNSQGMQVFQTEPFTVEERTIRVALPAALSSGVYVVSLIVENRISRIKWVVR